MSARFLALVPVFAVLSTTPAGAQLGAQQQVDCPPGLMPAPVAPNTSITGIPSPTGALAKVAKKKILGSKDSAKAETVPAKPKCLTPEEFATEAKAQQSAAMKGAATAALSATPIGMALMGAKAAAPIAGKVAGAVSSRFHRGPSKESWTKALATGRLDVADFSFDVGADGPTLASMKSLALLGDVLKSSDGKYVLRVTPESNGVTAADPKLAFLRGQLVMAALVAAGVPSDRISVAAPTLVSGWDNGPPKKTEAKLEVVPYVAAAPAPAKQ